VLGGSRARGAARSASGYDLGLYFSESAGLDVGCLLAAVKDLVDDPSDAALTEVGGWGPWIVGGGWLRIAGQKVDLLYRPIESVERVIRDCRNGHIAMEYQPGHPHGFCSAIWMGEIALCRPLSDPQGAIAALKAMTVPYPEKLREALIRRFQREILFSIENAQTLSRAAIRLTLLDARSARLPARPKSSSPSTGAISSMRRALSPRRRSCR
jgi:hypothetical protein